MRYFASIIMVAFLATLFAATQGLGESRQDGIMGRDAEQRSGEESMRSMDRGMQQQQRDQQFGTQQQQTSGQQLSQSKVRELQQALQEKGANPGQIDGLMGPNTRQAIREFQQDEGIAATGQLNEETLEALDLEAQEFMGAAPAFGEPMRERGMQQPQSGVQQRGQQQMGQQLSQSKVRELQQALQEKGASPGQIDGIMGPKTRQAIREFQQDEGIAATGQLNEETLEALDLEAQEFMGAAPAFGQEGQRDQRELGDRPGSLERESETQRNGMERRETQPGSNGQYR